MMKQCELKPEEWKDLQEVLTDLHNGGRVDKEYLTRLVMDYKEKRRFDDTYPMSNELASVLAVIVDKMLGNSRWRNYTADWKDEFRGRAIEHLLRYTHNFDPNKMKAGVGQDPYNYFAMIIHHSFVQAWNRLKQYTDNIVLYNDDISNISGWGEEVDGLDHNNHSEVDITKLDWSETL